MTIGGDASVDLNARTAEQNVGQGFNAGVHEIDIHVDRDIGSPRVLILRYVAKGNSDNICFDSFRHLIRSASYLRFIIKAEHTILLLQVTVAIFMCIDDKAEFDLRPIAQPVLEHRPIYMRKGEIRWFEAYHVNERGSGEAHRPPHCTRGWTGGVDDVHNWRA